MEQTENYLEDVLKKYFQRNIQIYINDEEYKSGKFLLYRFSTYANNYYIEFHIQRGKKIDTVKVPYPFDVEEHYEDGIILFDYRIKTFCKNNPEMEKKIREFASKNEGPSLNKFYDRIIEFVFS